jgi:protein TonB
MTPPVLTCPTKITKQPAASAITVMNDKNDMTSQPGPGTTLRDERTSPASRFTTRLLLQSGGRAKSILSNLKDLITTRAPKFAHSSTSTQTITLKDENFGRSQFASFAFHGSLALLLFMTFVARSPIPRNIPRPNIGTYFAPPADYLRRLILPPPSPGNHGGGSGGERSPIPMSAGDRPAVAREQITAPSVHTFPNAQLQVTPVLEDPIPMPAVSKGLPNWGDIDSNTLTTSDGQGCCAGMGNHRGRGIGEGEDNGGGPGKDGGIGKTSIGPPGNGVRSPSCAFCPRPEYSDQARQARFQGLVMLNVVVLADGRAGRIELVSGPGLGLDEKAIEAVRNWRFNPAIGPNGKPVAVTIPIEVQFQLF